MGFEREKKDMLKMMKI